MHIDPNSTPRRNSSHGESLPHRENPPRGENQANRDSPPQGESLPHAEVPDFIANGSKANRRREFYWTTLLFLVCLVVVCTLDNIFRKPGQGDWDTLWPMVLAVCVCYAGSIVSVMVNTEPFERKNPLGSLLLGMTIRTTVVIGAVLVATATKWANHNLFSMTLVGCYFSYLALESSLSIKRIHSRI